MKIRDFIERLSLEMSGHHRVFPPLEREELKASISKWKKNSLPDGFLDLLRHANGIDFWVDVGSPNGYFRILPLREIDYARQIMWGGALNDMEADAVPYPDWLGITDHQDGADFIVLDVDAHRYYRMDSYGADLKSPAGSNVNELLDYLWEHWIEPIKNNY